jgi:hypothetical protein
VSTKSGEGQDWIQNIGVMIAVIISIISLIQSKQSLDITREEKKVNINISGVELDNNEASYIPFPAGDFDPFPGTKGFISMQLLIKIDNLSQKRVSLRELHATPILEDPDSGEMNPFRTNGPNIKTDFNEPLRSFSNNMTVISLPFSLDQGESVNIIGIVGWPLDEKLSKILSDNLIDGKNDYKLCELKRLLEDNGFTLGRSIVEYTFPDKDHPEDKPIPIGYGKAKIIYRIDVITSYNTRHSAYVGIIPTFAIYQRVDWSLLKNM